MQLDIDDARERHAELSCELILHSFCRVGDHELHVELPIPDDNAREAIARIARAHWTNFALEEPEQDYVYGNVEGRLRLLGVLLRQTGGAPAAEARRAGIQGQPRVA